MEWLRGKDLNLRPLGYEFCAPFLMFLVRSYFSRTYVPNPLGDSRCLLLVCVATGRNFGRTSSPRLTVCPTLLFLLRSVTVHQTLVSPYRRDEDLDNYRTQSVYPALYERLETAFPEFNFEGRGNHWGSAPLAAGFSVPRRARAGKEDRGVSGAATGSGVSSVSPGAGCTA